VIAQGSFADTGPIDCSVASRYARRVSWMPSVGTVVRLKDERIAALNRVGPGTNEGQVIFHDGHEEPTNAWQIAELLTDEEAAHGEPLQELRAYLDQL
jgi:hypothetical protein